MLKINAKLFFIRRDTCRLTGLVPCLFTDQASSSKRCTRNYIVMAKKKYNKKLRPVCTHICTECSMKTVVETQVRLG